MRVLVIVKASKDSEQGVLPDEQMMRAMGDYNEELVKAGIMQSGEGLKPSSFGKRIRFASGKASLVIDGPFAETKELIAGFWIWKVKSIDEAVAWARRCPVPASEEEAFLEIRPFYDMADFGAEYSPEVHEQEARIRKAAEQN